MKIIGYMRFSHPARSDVIVQRKLDAKQLKEFIWSEQVMARRFYCFENFALPSLIAQSDENFKVCIFISPQMPQKYKSKLYELCKGVPTIAIHEEDAAEDEKIHHICDRWYDQNRGNPDEKVLHFRIDDDDAMSFKLVELMRRYGKRLEPGEALSFPNGYVAGMYKGKPHILKVSMPFIAQGLGFIRKGNAKEVSPFRGSHDKTCKTHNTLLVEKPAAYIYIYHPSSDTVSFQDKRFAKYISGDPNFDTPNSIQVQTNKIAFNFPFLNRKTLLDKLKEVSTV